MAMSKSERVETHFHGGDEAPELDGYRPISPLVIAACVAGLTSLLAIVHPLLWVFPVVAVVLSMWAIVHVSAAHSRYGGRSAAVAALCLAALVGSYAPARAISYDRAINAQARVKAEEWISLVQQGHLSEAHQLSLNSGERFQGPGLLSSHYADVPPSSSPSVAENEMDSAPMLEPPPGEQLTAFATEPAVAKLLEFGTQARIEHLQNVAIANDYSDLKITQRFRASGVHGGQPQSFEFLVRATRHEQKEFANWKVGELELVK
ncbi:MAG TPA: hypothetical protein VMM76_09155 [Pirellulaceae bacterium]|nr:hypothetical protein [Pirellulaceae bacterium]